MRQFGVTLRLTVPARSPIWIVVNGGLRGWSVGGAPRSVIQISAMNEPDIIVRNPEILGGTPCIRGTRLNVYAIAARVHGGETPEEIAAENPGVTPEMIMTATEYAGNHPQVEHPEGRPWRKKASKSAA